MTKPLERGFLADLRQLYGFMSPARRRSFFGLLALMLLGAVAEMAAIVAVVPFLSLLAGAFDAGGGQPHFRWVSDMFETAGAHGAKRWE